MVRYRKISTSRIVVSAAKTFKKQLVTVQKSVIWIGWTKEYDLNGQSHEK